MLIVKRDGTQVQFDRDKIINAVNKAFIEVDGKLYETDTAYDIAVEIEQAARQLAKEDRILSVEAIQDLVEDYLMRSERIRKKSFVKQVRLMMVFSNWLKCRMMN